jgi:hypothetical protein
MHHIFLPEAATETQNERNSLNIEKFQSSC